MSSVLFHRRPLKLRLPFAASTAVALIAQLQIHLTPNRSDHLFLAALDYGHAKVRRGNLPGFNI
ncbi:hypothetical protein TIFTF001_012656 [Ficus carica]|uniref:Uncharacterized protein n=1 Tax=Ficus carica TaxID=3494 RepID=A0AA88A2S2_FICCA|nr:hypothetical protein TIFTF001_012656 [Ficus carica]